MTRCHSGSRIPRAYQIDDFEIKTKQKKKERQETSESEPDLVSQLVACKLIIRSRMNNY